VQAMKNRQQKRITATIDAHFPAGLRKPIEADPLEDQLHFLMSVLPKREAIMVFDSGLDSLERRYVTRTARRLRELEALRNSPPFHAWCRCQQAAVSLDMMRNAGWLKL
jgi:hypothetical protein